MMDKKEIAERLSFAPKFDEKGLIACITTCSQSGDVLMFAFMNSESLQKTLETGEAHYWSRSRQRLWHKGEESGHTHKVMEIRTDCDQDCILLKVKTSQGTCHTGRKSCFYRKIEIGTLSGKMQFIEAEKIFDPNEIYKQSMDFLPIHDKLESRVNGKE